MSLDAELRALAAQKDLAADLVWRLLRHPPARRAVALLRRDLTEAMIEEIIALGSARSLAANCSAVPAEVRARLAEHPEPAVRSGIAAGVTDDPPGLPARLADDPDPSVRMFLAMNDHLPSELRDRLAADPDPRVRRQIVHHWRDAPERVRRALMTDPDPHVRTDSVRKYVPPADLLPVLVADPVTRAAAVGHAGPSPELAADPDSAVRVAVADHPNLPAVLREQAEALLARAGL
ncbi:hypothetical protein [Embleya sp. NPDC050493]|uniref:hypothetical protein n=1 Tax=Embleya sp. NPDC050493 TaxID=3363989 RepID=UPI0037A39BBD